MTHDEYRAHWKNGRASAVLAISDRPEIPRAVDALPRWKQAIIESAEWSSMLLLLLLPLAMLLASDDTISWLAVFPFMGLSLWSQRRVIRLRRELILEHAAEDADYFREQTARYSLRVVLAPAKASTEDGA